MCSTSPTPHAATLSGVLVLHTAQHVETRQLYAIKVFSVFDRDKRAQLLKEVETLWGMECPSLINFVGGYLKVRINENSNCFRLAGLFLLSDVTRAWFLGDLLL